MGFLCLSCDRRRTFWLTFSSFDPLQLLLVTTIGATKRRSCLEQRVSNVELGIHSSYIVQIRYVYLVYVCVYTIVMHALQCNGNRKPVDILVVVTSHAPPPM